MKKTTLKRDENIVDICDAYMEYSLCTEYAIVIIGKFAYGPKRKELGEISKFLERQPFVAYSAKNIRRL